MNPRKELRALSTRITELQGLCHELRTRYGVLADAVADVLAAVHGGANLHHHPSLLALEEAYHRLHPPQHPATTPRGETYGQALADHAARARSPEAPVARA